MRDEWLPISALLRRELLRHLRRWRVVVAIACLGGVIAWHVQDQWPAEVLPRLQFSELFDTVSLYIGILYVLAAMLVLPGYAAMSIRSELDADTYELMRLSLLTPTSILVGTLGNVMGLYALAVVATFPAAMPAMVFASWPLRSSLLGVAIIVVAALLCAVTGLYASMLRRGTSDVIATAYGYAGATVIFSFFIPAIWFVITNKVFWPQIVCLSTLTLFVAIRVRSTIDRMRVYSFERVDERSVLRIPSLREMWLQNVTQRRRIVYPDGRNPVFVREFGDALRRAQINKGSLGATVIVGIGIFAMSMFFTAMDRHIEGGWWMANPSDALRWYFVTSMLLAAATIPGISTPAWTNDRNTEMEEALDLTLLTRRQRFLGRACAAAALPFIVTAVWAGGFSPLLRAVFDVNGGVAIALIGMAGLFATMLNLLALGRRIARLPLSTPAAVVVVHLIAGAYMGLPYAALPKYGDTISMLQSLLAAISPISAIVCAVRAIDVRISAVPLPVYALVFCGIQFFIFAAITWTELRAEGGKRGGD